MRAGELWEIDNELVHTVENRSDEDRIHIIVDWMPNHAGRPVETVLLPEPAAGSASQLGDRETLNAMVAEAHQNHRSGQVRRAESIYMQVLDIDATHFNCNNLLGLLCLQTKRPEEAVKYIRRALDVDSNNAQSHSNLALALKDLGRLPEAAAHFQQALILKPGNPKTHNNLGNIFRSLGRLDDAIRSYQQALLVQPDYGEALHNLGSALLHAERFADAVQILERSLAINPQFAATRAELNRALAGLRNIHTALDGGKTEK